LHLLSQISYVLRDPDFYEAVVQQDTREKIFAEARRVEAALNSEDSHSTDNQ
jgi:hypothetical protein